MPTVVYFGGAGTDPETALLLAQLQRVTGLSILLTQGSYSSSVAASAGTHDGGGVVDINLYGWSPATISRAVDTARSMGGVAWHRTVGQGFSGEHIHMVRRDCGDLSAGARAQMVQYLAGQNGLASHAPDDGTRAYVGVTWASYQSGSVNVQTWDTKPSNPTPTPAAPVIPKDWFDMATQADLQAALAGLMPQIRQIVNEEVHKVLVSDGVAGAADMGTARRADGSYPTGAYILTLVTKAAADVSKSQNYAGANDGIAAIRAKLGA